MPGLVHPPARQVDTLYEHVSARVRSYGRVIWADGPHLQGNIAGRNHDGDRISTREPAQSGLIAERHGFEGRNCPWCRKFVDCCGYERAVRIFGPRPDTVQAMEGGQVSIANKRNVGWRTRKGLEGHHVLERR